MLSSMDTAKTHEIMARYRPIVPRPVPLPDCPYAAPSDSPTTVALKLRPRQCRVRKRSRSAIHIPSLFSNMVPIVRFPNPNEQSTQPSLYPPTIPVERDLLQKLQEPLKVLVPQPVRLVRSRISVARIETAAAIPAPAPASPEQIEEDLESEGLPAVISDSNNRVRLANAAYNEMVGQPELPWLELMVNPRWKRISGEVFLNLTDVTPELPACTNGFSCRVKIEWISNKEESVVNVVNAPCDVIRLNCDTKDYRFTWRFRTTEGSTSTTKYCKVD